MFTFILSRIEKTIGEAKTHVESYNKHVASVNFVFSLDV